LLRPGRRPRRPRGRGLSSGAVGFRLPIGRRNKTGHAIDKTLRSLDRLLRALGRYLRAGPDLIVGKFFEIEGAAKERSQFHVNARIVFHQPPKLILRAPMALGYLSRSLKDKGARRVKTRQIRRAACFVGPMMHAE